MLETTNPESLDYTAVFSDLFGDLAAGRAPTLPKAVWDSTAFYNAFLRWAEDVETDCEPLVELYWSYRSDGPCERTVGVDVTAYNAFGPLKMSKANDESAETDGPWDLLPEDLAEFLMEEMDCALGSAISNITDPEPDYDPY